MSMYKVLPDRFFVHCSLPGAGFVNSPVKEVVAHAAGKHPAGCPLVKDCVALEIKCLHGSRWYGVSEAAIGSDLRMHVRLYPGCERDEVVRKWVDSDHTFSSKGA